MTEWKWFHAEPDSGVELTAECYPGGGCAICGPKSWHDNLAPDEGGAHPLSAALAASQAEARLATSERNRHGKALRAIVAALSDSNGLVGWDEYQGLAGVIFTAMLGAGVDPHDFAPRRP